MTQTEFQQIDETGRTFRFFEDGKWRGTIWDRGGFGEWNVALLYEGGGLFKGVVVDSEAKARAAMIDLARAYPLPAAA